MSVINTMLKDLEQRGAQNNLSQDEVLRGLSSGTAAPVRAGGFNPYVGSLLGVLGVFAILAVLYMFTPYQLVTANGQIKTQIQADLAAQQPEDSVAAQAAINISKTSTKDTVVIKPEPPVVEQAVVSARGETVAEQPPETQTAVPVEGNENGAQAAKAVSAGIEHTPAAAAVTDQAQADEHIDIKPPETERRYIADVSDAVTTAQRVAAPNEAAGIEDADITKTPREPSDSEKSQETYAGALVLFRQGDIETSRQQLKQALGLDPSNSKAAQLLAAIHIGDNRPELAGNVLDRTLQLQPADQELMRLYLQVQVQLKNYAQAITLMERRIRINSPEDIAYLAGLYQKNSDHLGAVKLYAQALKMKPSHSVWWMGQGISFEALGRSEEAMKSYQQSISSGRLNTQLVKYVLGRIDRIEKNTGDSMS